MIAVIRVSKQHLIRNLLNPIFYFENFLLLLTLPSNYLGSALELPYIYKADAAGKVNLQDTFKQGAKLLSSAKGLLAGGVTSLNPDKIHDAKMLIAGASGLFSSFAHRDDAHVPGLQHDYNYANDTFEHQKNVWLISGN